LAKLHLESLKGRTNGGLVRETLKTLPKGYAEIDKAYDAVVARIKSQGGDWTVLAEKALSWILLARRKITMFELQHGLAVKIHHPGGAVAEQISPEEELDEEKIDDEEESHEKSNNVFDKSCINRSHELFPLVQVLSQQTKKPIKSA
jgi:hypothetical protein